MKLEEALIKIISEFGIKILTEPRMLNMLNDYRGFDDMQSARHILKAMQEEGLISLLLTDRNNISKEHQLINLLHNNYGFDLSLIRSLNNSLKFSLHHKEIVSTEVSDEDLDNGWRDAYGVIYSQDCFRLLSIGLAKESGLTHYSVIQRTKVICDNAFADCKALTQITIPDHVTRIGGRAFYNCSSLLAITLPNKLKYIGPCAFLWCQALKSICVPESVDEIDYLAFSGCSSLLFVTLLGRVKHFGVSVLGEDVFKHCPALKRINIPRGSYFYYLALLPGIKDKLFEML